MKPLNKTMEFPDKTATTLWLNKRWQINGENNCFISMENHKEDFQNNPTIKLINHAKNEVRKISKVILDTRNKNIRENLQLNK